MICREGRCSSGSRRCVRALTVRGLRGHPSVDFPTCAENRLSCRLFYSEEREDDKTTEGNGSGDTRLDSFARWKSSDGPEYDYRGILCRVGGEIIYGETGKRTTSTLIHSGREAQIKEGTKQ